MWVDTVLDYYALTGDRAALIGLVPHIEKRLDFGQTLVGCGAMWGDI